MQLSRFAEAAREPRRFVSFLLMSWDGRYSSAVNRKPAPAEPQ